MSDKIVDAIKAVFSDDPSPSVWRVGRWQYRALLNQAYETDHARLKALWNAGYRGDELRND